MILLHTHLLSPNFTPISPLNKSLYGHSLPLLTNPTSFISSKSIRAVSPVSTTPIQAPLDVDSLSKQFRGYGVSFSSLSDGCVMTLALKNGSVVKLMLPSGLITSYKAMMWHEGSMELLHTTVSNGKDGGEAIINGGVSLAFLSLDIQGNSVVSLPFANSWVLNQVTGNARQYIQVQLINKHEDNIEVEHIITLEQEHLRSQIVIRNLSDSSSLRFVGSIMSHLSVSTPEATFACGLERSEFCSTGPISTDFSLIHPSLRKKNQSSRSNFGPIALSELVSNWNARNQAQTHYNVEEEEEEEDDDYKNLADEMSRIYMTAPRSFTVMDRGKRNSLIIGRDGFEELYVFSPGSSHQWYGRYAYICVGQAALLQPITLEPKAEWKGEQHLVNPNL